MCARFFFSVAKRVKYSVSLGLQALCLYLYAYPKGQCEGGGLAAINSNTVTANKFTPSFNVTKKETFVTGYML